MASSTSYGDARKTGEPDRKEETASRIHGQANDYQQDPSLTRDNNDVEKKEKKPGIVKRVWTKLGLDAGTLMMMGKAGLPPTIALSMYQANKIAQLYTTLGYLVAIISILGFCIMPRAKFIQTMTLNVVGTCTGAAFGLLMLYTGVKAREHSTTPGAAPQLYNSSQSVVLGVWLFFQIYVVNTIKAKFPQLAFPTIIYAIQVNVAATNGFLFQTTAQSEAFVKKLLYTFLTGFAIATGVSLFVIPVSCRKVVMKETTGYIGLLKGALGAHKAYIHSLEGKDMYEQTYTPEEKSGRKKKEKEKKAEEKPEIAAIKKMTSTLQELHGKLTADLPFAKREVAYGKLTPDDFQTMYKHLRAIFLPVLGLGSLMDLFGRGAEINHWSGASPEQDDEARKKAVSEWNEMFQWVHEPFNNIFQALDDGLEHVLLRLQLTKVPKKKKGKGQEDTEEKGDIVKPGDDGFAEHFEKQVALFFSNKEPTLRHWVENKGIKLRDDYFSRPDALDDETLMKLPSITTRKRDKRQLYLLLYIMFLLNSVSRATLEFVKFADAHNQSTAKSKLILPGGRRFRKWMKSIFKCSDSSEDDETTVAGLDRSSTTVNLGEAYKHKKDPEHLEPRNAWEKFGNGIRSFSHFLGSPESSFGFRAACATMSIGIIAFLRHTQTFFVEQRLVWALIMIAISMTPTAGQAIFQFILRIGGTIVAMIVAWLVWYIPGQHTAGILVFLWLFVSLGFYIPLKKIELIIVGLISVVTATMIIGYELQVRKIGIQAAEASTHQPAYPIYELGPYRLLTVAGGLAVAFFWTVFPYPITEHSALRVKLGGALYLSANLYSIMHEQVMGRIRGDMGDEVNDKTSPGYALIKARNKVFAKQMLTLQGLKMHAGFVKWEFPIGGKFPVDEYKKILGYVENIVNYTALLGYASQSFPHPGPDPATPQDPASPDVALHTSPQWFEDFRRIVGAAKVTSHEITSLLALLSSSITNGQPLPPYLHAPPGYQLAQKLEELDADILSIRHIAEPGYAIFAVMAISTSCINMDVERLLKAVKKLVGEMDFSFHVVSTKNGSATSSQETLGKEVNGKED